MRILILVLSYTEPPYNGLMQAQQETWDSIDSEGINTIYYHGGSEQKTHLPIPKFSLVYQENCSDDYYMMHWKFKLCLDHIEKIGPKYDFIFRTNSSSYINKKRLLQHAETLPKERCFAGWSLGEKEAVSGAGIWLSPDMVSILRDELPEGPNIEEDILIGRILHGKHGIEIIDDRTRYDVWNAEDAPLDRYHFRFRTHDRISDIKNMYRVHQRVKNFR